MATAAKKLTHRPTNKALARKKATADLHPPGTVEQSGAVLPEKVTKSPAEVAKDLGEELVHVSVPKPFTLTDDDHKQYDYGPATLKMPISHANHWYAKANGVTHAGD